MTPYRILIVEDDHSLAEVLEYNFEQAGYEVMIARDGRDGLNQAQSKLPDLVILDLMLPVLDGFDVCRTLRAEPQTRGICIVILTAKSEETDQVVGFRLGADDYVTKPFSVKVLLERVKALLKRRHADEEEREVLVSQGILLDRRRHQVFVEERVVDLTPSEFQLLEALIRHPGRAFNRNELIDAALGERTVVLERTIDVHIRSIRKKLGDHAELVETVRGVGYRFRDPLMA